MRIYVSGSLAYDRIMDFPGKFSDHILPDKIHILNVCFLVNGLAEKFGGTAGNIAYSLALLGERPLILSAAGKDFDAYATWLKRHGLSLDCIRVIPEEFTAGAYITTDQADNQITGFNPGAMRHMCEASIDPANLGGSVAVVSPGNADDMRHYPRLYKKLNIPDLFDPGQQIPVFSGEQLVEAITGSRMLITNDYELEMVIKATGLSKAQLLERTETIVTTLAEKGAEIAEADRVTRIPAARPARVADPTGAGDAFRAGLLKGLATGKTLLEACAMGSTCASFCVENYGTQEHTFTEQEFWTRHQENYGGA